MIHISVCDNEDIVREDIITIVKKQAPHAKVSAFSSGEELLASKEYFHIHIIDIEMEKMSGIEVAKSIRDRQKKNNIPKSIIIFVTGYREYMEDAFDVNAFHYLVKPIDENKFSQVLGNAIKEASVLDDNLRKYIVLKNSGMQQKLYLKDIYYIESSNKKVIIHTADEQIVIYGKMEQWEKQLGDTFYRCHRCYLVNMEKIAAYSTDTINLTNGESLILAQKKYSEFVKAYMRYAELGGIINV